MSNEPTIVYLVECQACGFVGQPMDAKYVTREVSIERVKEHRATHRTTTVVALLVLETQYILMPPPEEEAAP